MMRLYSDGGSRGNPGEAAIGFVIYDKNEVVYEKCLELLGSENEKRFKMKQIIQESIDDFIKKFTDSVNQELTINLLQHPRIKAFFKLSSHSFKDEELQVMDIKGFVNAKKDSNKFCLQEVVNDGYNKSKLCKQDQKTNIPSKNNKNSNATAEDLSNFFKNR